ncbi:hypothetical protein CR194_02055 [Salipaludibacillus keqinensis]|uniref:Uncharacterized protein n=2 Tax=Salipaludibacillus keqinensis TaxID=2045207 RepID=A0A323THU0_9BACI|nr:hypothetical protein CR194_02055 [Salipaludibacillus keqinensis]
MGNLEQDQKEESVSFQSTVALIGFVGGTLWSFIGYLAYYFSFTKFGPSIILMPWALGDWKHDLLGQWIGILVIGILSIGIAFMYRLIFAKVNQVWPGILFGIALWLIVFGFLHPLFEEMEPILRLDLNSLVTTLSLYIIYGLFIGYSVSYEYHERTVHEGETIQD